MTQEIAARRPRIRMISAEADRLADLALNAQERVPDVSKALMAEIDRAQTTTAERIGDDVVTMGALVTFADEAAGQDRTVRIVYPGEADIGEGRISILTPIGAALIGLRVGQSILWPDRTGRERRLAIRSVQRD